MICYPPDTDWSAKFSEAELEELRADAVSRARLEKAEAFAWTLLASLTLYGIGTCPLTVRPRAAQEASRGGFLTATVSGGSWPMTVIGRPYPYISGGVWYNACGCGSSCECDSMPAVELPGPVGSIVTVKIDGEILPAAAYRVDNGTLLVRTDGGEWPLCDQDFEVTYYRGMAPNILSRAAAGALAAEFYEASIGGPCRLPNNVTSVTRAGESYDLEGMDFPEGDTGIPEVDALVRVYNPNRLKVRPGIASPDAYTPRVTTWRK